MERKREEARRAAEERARAEAAEAKTRAIEEVIPWLRQLGFRADQARQAAALCRTIPDAPLEERVRVALSSLAPSRGVRRVANQVGTAA